MRSRESRYHGRRHRARSPRMPAEAGDNPGMLAPSLTSASIESNSPRDGTEQALN